AHGLREEPEFVTARAGEAVVLRCDVIHPVTGQPPPYVVEWFKFGVPIPIFIKFGYYPPHVDPEYAGRASLHDKASLRLEQVRSEDQGWYECKVLMLDQQYDTFHNGSWVHLTINAPPTFTETPPQYIEAKEGGSVTMTCTAFGNPKPIVTWLKEGTLLGASGKYQVSDGSLTVTSVSREDRGAYTCRAYSIQGEAVHTTHLLVQGPPFIVSPPENITVNISQDALLTCRAEAYPGNLTYTWYWQDENVYFQNDLKLRVRILIDGTLIIFRVKPEDAGKYTCVPSNSLGRSPSASAYLTVQYPARVLNMPPVIYVPVGIHGYIRCPVDAEPPATVVKWNKDGRPLQVEKNLGWTLMEDGSIRIEEATEEALGTYTCVPYNTLGTMGQSAPARLVLKDPPYFTVLPGWEYRQEAGRELLIPCAAAGDPFPVITWRKVGKPSRSKHSALPSGSLQFRALSKEDHGEWECIATNVVTSITASTHLTVIGTSPHAPGGVRVQVSMTTANVSWEPGYDGGFEQTFSVWMKRAQFGPHDWLSLPVPLGPNWLLVDALEPETAYQFSVLAQNRLGTSAFSEVVTVNTLAFPITTPEPLVLVTPPRCLTANRTQQGVLLSWLPPANHSFPIDRYVMEFRVGERWEMLDDAIPGTDGDFFAKDLSQDTWYEFRVLAVMQDLVSEPSNIAGVSSTGTWGWGSFYSCGDTAQSPRESGPRSCFHGGWGFAISSCADLSVHKEAAERKLADLILLSERTGLSSFSFFLFLIYFYLWALSTLACVLVSRPQQVSPSLLPDPPLSITHCRKSLESPLSSGKVSPESIRTLRPPSESSDDQGQPAAKRMLSPSREKELSLYKKTKRAISSKKYSVAKAEAEAEATTPIELISRGPDGRFVMGPSEVEPPVKGRRIEGFPFAEETDMYPEFRQSDEENEDPLVPTSVAALKSQLTPLSSSQESYLPPPAYSPRFQPRGLEGPGGLEGPPPFYMPEVGSPLSSVMSSPPLHMEGPFGHPTIPEENGENASNSTLPLTQTPTGGRSPEPWGRPDCPFGGLETPSMMFPHQLHPCDVAESLQPKACLPRGLPPTFCLSSGKVSPESIRTLRPPSESSDDQGQPAAKRMLSPSREKELSLYKKTKRAISSKKYSVAKAEAEAEATTPIELISRGPDGRFVMGPSEVEPPVKGRRIEGFPFAEETDMYPEFRQSDEENEDPLVPTSVAALKSQLTPLSSSQESYLPPPAYSPRFQPRGLEGPGASTGSPSQSSRSGSPSYRPAVGFTTLATGYPSPPLGPAGPADNLDVFGQTPSPRRMGEELLRPEPPPPQLPTSGTHPPAPGNAAAPERLEALKYQRIKKPKKSSKGSSKSKKRSDGPASQAQQLPNSQVLWPDEAVCLRKKKRHARPDPFARLSDLCHRQLPEDQTAILNSVDHDDPGHATLL
ncbi:PREDICTED: protein turtle homolog B, partial [Myotis brandtii]|uniref:protein turtle homolog B n=1 Tax=Myotis brandtii TaxID=109478 RepID=UPI000703EF45